MQDGLEFVALPFASVNGIAGQVRHTTTNRECSTDLEYQGFALGTRRDKTQCNQQSPGSYAWDQGYTGEPRFFPLLWPACCLAKS